MNTEWPAPKLDADTVDKRMRGFIDQTNTYDQELEAVEEELAAMTEEDRKKNPERYEDLLRKKRECEQRIAQTLSDAEALENTRKA